MRQTHRLLMLLSATMLALAWEEQRPDEKSGASKQLETVRGARYPSRSRSKLTASDGPFPSMTASTASPCAHTT